MADLLRVGRYRSERVDIYRVGDLLLQIGRCGMNNNLPAKSEFLIYRTDDGEVKLDVRLEDETIWLTQQMMADLFRTTQQNISQHIRNIID